MNSAFALPGRDGERERGENSTSPWGSERERESVLARLLATSERAGPVGALPRRSPPRRHGRATAGRRRGDRGEGGQRAAAARRTDGEGGAAGERARSLRKPPPHLLYRPKLKWSRSFLYLAPRRFTLFVFTSQLAQLVVSAAAAATTTHSRTAAPERMTD